jgi:hypothetical protein
MQLANRVLQFHYVGVASFNVRQRLPGLLRLHNDLKDTTVVIVSFEKPQTMYNFYSTERKENPYALSENGRIALFQHFLKLFVGSRTPG